MLKVQINAWKWEEKPVLQQTSTTFVRSVAEAVNLLECLNVGSSGRPNIFDSGWRGGQSPPNMDGTRMLVVSFPKCPATALEQITKSLN